MTDRSSCSPTRPDHGERGADDGDVAFPRHEPENDAVDRSADLDRRLVGLDLDDRLVEGDGIAFADEPARDLPFGEALAEIRERERVRHVLRSVVGARPAGDATTPGR